MLDLLNPKGEKKVEYVELIYDLIFVYLIGRNGELLHTMEGGFIRPMAYFTYLASTMVILQIWYYSTLFINRYGGNRLREHIGLFVNMYLLYYMAEGIRDDWGAYYYRYSVAWALILVNLAVQYWMQKRCGEHQTPWEQRHMTRNIVILLIQAGIVLVFIPIYLFTGYALGPWAVVFGMVAPLLTWRLDEMVPVEFAHLSERVMLYVVFTFGEMVLSITGYFSGGFNFQTVYFSLMAFLVVVGLFSSYGYFYDHLLDRERTTSGTTYMLLHVVLILALGHIINALELMPKPEVDLIPKNIFLVAAVLAFFLCMMLTERYSLRRIRGGAGTRALLIGGFAGYAVLAAIFYRSAYVSIAITVVFIFLQLVALHRAGEKRLD